MLTQPTLVSFQKMPPRRSTRSTQPTVIDTTSDQASFSAASKPTKKAKATAGRKRAAADESDEEQVKKPAKKKSKKDTKDKVEQVEDDDDDKDEEIVDDSNMVTVLKRGAAPVDPTCGFISEFWLLPCLSCHMSRLTNALQSPIKCIAPVTMSGMPC
jgi:hypothetical protein